MSVDAYAVILAGGKGERFWPLSTSRRPKQFLSLVGDKPLLAQAVDRLEGVITPENVLVITNGDLSAAASKAAPQLPVDNIIGEPIGRDTAAAIALGAALIKKRNPEAVFTVLTADHVIKDLDIFRQTLKDGLELAGRENVLVTIGITPSGPSTGYGYIESGDLHLKTDCGTQLLKARKFVEKPDRATAESYIAAGNYFWNSGMFMWSVSSIEKALKQFRPALSRMMGELAPAIGTPGFSAALEQVYGELEKISIDYAVMEKADNVIVARGTFSWDDVGAWPAIENHFEPDENGNIVVGTLERVDAESNIVVSRERLTALLGVRDLIVVQAPGVTLVCPKNRAQDVKKLVQQLHANGGYEEVL